MIMSPSAGHVLQAQPTKNNRNLQPLALSNFFSSLVFHLIYIYIYIMKILSQTKKNWEPYLNLSFSFHILTFSFSTKKKVLIITFDTEAYNVLICRHFLHGIIAIQGHEFKKKKKNSTVQIYFIILKIYIYTKRI